MTFLFYLPKIYFYFFKKKNPNTSLPPPSTFTPPNLANIGYRERQRLCLSQIQISVFLVNLLRILILELLVLNVLNCSWIPNLLGFFGGWWDWEGQWDWLGCPMWCRLANDDCHDRQLWGLQLPSLVVVVGFIGRCLEFFFFSILFFS